MAVKKRPRRIATTSKKAAAPARGKKAAGRKAVKKSAAKVSRPAKKATVKKTKKREPWGEFDDHGFRVGSDSSIIVDILIEGGAGREELNEIIAERLPSTKTRGGNDKNISSLVSGLLGRLMETGGYEIEESWRLVPLNGSSAKSSTKKKKVAIRAKKKVVARKPRR